MLIRSLRSLGFIVLLSSASLFAQGLAAPATPAAIGASSNIYQSVVRIEASTQVANYRTPWNSGRFSGGIGTGFLVGENLFLTNAHVISDARRLLITKHGSPHKHAARVLHVAHDCDLALLELEDFSAFKGLPYLKIGTLPKLESQVRVIGYPVGGERLSVTRGVVSRIDFVSYSHTLLDSHLVVQIDAAINPGNSGGPVLQNGKVVGVAFQGLRSADNTGYMIPVPVINRFLKDVEDGTYDKYVDIGIAEFQLFNSAMREQFGLKNNGIGVLVAAVTPESPCEGVLQENDILIEMDGNTIDNAGMILLDDDKINMNEVVERKFAGDKVALRFIRDGKEMTGTITLKPFPPSAIYSIQYEKKPRYIVHGGLVFQPLDRNCFAAHKFRNEELRYIFTNYIKDEIFKKREDLVVLTQILSDPLTTRSTGFTGTIVDSINGTDVKNLKHAYELLQQEPDDGFLVLRLAGKDRPLVLPFNKIAEATQRVSQRYSIKTLHYLEK